MNTWKIVELKTLPWGSTFFMGDRRYEVSVTLDQSNDGLIEGVDQEAGKYFDFHPNSPVRVAA